MGHFASDNCRVTLASRIERDKDASLKLRYIRMSMKKIEKFVRRMRMVSEDNEVQEVERERR